MKRLDHALRLASLGFLIAPLQANKKVPFAAESWQVMQTTDPLVIAGWFANRKDMNYSVCPGPNSVIIDLDEDAVKDKHGIAVMEMLDAVNFEDAILGSTFTVRTPRGGLHIYLHVPHPISNRAGGFPNGVDVRGAGGYVLGPGCHTEKDGASTARGDYEIEHDVAIINAPAWVMERLDVARDRDTNAGEIIGEEDTDTAMNSIRSILTAQTSWPTEGEGGDSKTYEFIALLRNYGAVSQDTMFMLLNEPYQDAQGEIASWNERCSPSWSDEDLARKIENAYEYATSAAGSKGGLLESMEDAGVEYLNRVDPELAKIQEGIRSKLDALYFPGDALTKRPTRREYVVDQWMLAHGTNLILAFRSTGKSIVMIDLCLKIACDMSWFKTKVAEDWAVVYCCGEDDEGMQAQMDAWIAEHGNKPEPDRFIVMTGVPDLNNQDECFEWIKFLKEKLDGRRAVFAIDTWQRATSNASQNDDQLMNFAVKMADFIAKQLGGPSFIACHPPKGNENTVSGSMVVENQSSAIWKMAADSVVKKLMVTRIKGKGAGNYLKLSFREVNLKYNDQWGKPATAIVVDFEGNNEGDSPHLKAMNTTLKSLWAQIINNIMVDAPGNKDNDFTKGDICTRLIAWRESHDADPYLRDIIKWGDVFYKDVSRMSTPRKVLGFVAGCPIIPCVDTYNGIYVTQSGKGAHKFIRQDLISYRTDHPEREPPPPIPMVESEDSGEIAF